MRIGHDAMDSDCPEMCSVTPAAIAGERGCNRRV